MFRFQNVGNFFQAAPKLGNQFSCDNLLQRFSANYFLKKDWKAISDDLENFGGRVADDIYELHLQCENNPPRHQPFDSWGHRVDKLITCEAWKKMKRISAQEGLVSIAYERNFGEYSRVYQILKLFLYSPSSGLYHCPLAMTDGAAKIIEKLNLKDSLGEAYSKLTSRDPEKFWTSGQWMTERAGGSDVANGTETYAVPQEDGSYKLFGYKWFSSATDADMAITLARIVDENGKSIEGTRGLSLFYLQVRDPETDALNGIQIQTLKNKLGTRQLPTAELLLSGTRALCISPPGRGVAGISSMLLLTRVHTAMAGIANMRRIINLATDYSQRRTAFGKSLDKHPLHMQTLARMEVNCRAAFLFLMEVARLVGKDDVGSLREHEAQLVRILSPLLKLFSCKQAMQVVSEGLECFGGQGYIEDTGLPSILRDSQVLPIWEGTTNILSLDVLRGIRTSNGDTLKAFHSEVHGRCEAAGKCCPSLAAECEKVLDAASTLLQFVTRHENCVLETAARDLAFGLSKTYMAMLLLDFAAQPNAHVTDIAAAKRWCNAHDFSTVMSRFSRGVYSKEDVAMDYELVMENYL